MPYTNYKLQQSFIILPLTKIKRQKTLSTTSLHLLWIKSSDCEPKLQHSIILLWLHYAWRSLRPLYTGWGPLCLPCATIKFARLQNGFLTCSGVVNRRFRYCHGYRSCCNFEDVAQRSPGRLVAQKRQKGSMIIAKVAEWRHSGR
jgi:hypothetical protein